MLELRKQHLARSVRYKKEQVKNVVFSMVVAIEMCHSMIHICVILYDTYLLNIYQTCNIFVKKRKVDFFL